MTATVAPQRVVGVHHSLPLPLSFLLPFVLPIKLPEQTAELLSPTSETIT